MFPFLGSHDVMASPLARGLAAPKGGLDLDQSSSFFLVGQGFVFLGGGGVSADDRQTVSQIAVHHWLLTGWDSHSREVGSVWGCKGRQSGLGCQ